VLLARFVIIMMIVGWVQGCGSLESVAMKGAIQPDETIFQPNRMFLRDLPKGNDSYSQGMRDGCQTFVGIIGAGALRLLPEKIDGYRLSSDPGYLRGFNDGGSYCTHYLDWEIH